MTELTKYEQQVLNNQVAIMSSLATIMLATANPFTNDAAVIMNKCIDQTAELLGVDLGVE